MLTQEQLKEKAESMQKYLEEKTGLEPLDLIKKAENLNVLIAISGNCLADCRRWGFVPLNLN